MSETCGHMPFPGLSCGKPKGHGGFGHATSEEPTATSWPDGPDYRTGDYRVVTTPTGEQEDR